MSVARKKVKVIFPKKKKDMIRRKTRMRNRHRLPAFRMSGIGENEEVELGKDGSDDPSLSLCDMTSAGSFDSGRASPEVTGSRVKNVMFENRMMR